MKKEREALKGKVNQVTKQKSSENKTGTKSSVSAVKKNLTLETDNFGGAKDETKKDEPDMAPSDAKADTEKTDPYPEKKEEPEMGGDREEFDEDEEDDDLARSDESPMTREKLE